MNECKWGKTSQQRIMTCCSEIQIFCGELIRYLPKEMDVTVLDGYRNETRQNEAYHDGRSTKQWPESKHNRLPSDAIDMAPWPVHWRDDLRFARMIGFATSIFEMINNRRSPENQIQWRHGSDWDQDGYSIDETFIDQVHIEILRPGDRGYVKL